MNAAHVHLAVNHLPVVGMVAALLVLALAALRKSEELKRLALIFLVAVGVTCGPTYFSGQEAEEVVEHLPGVEHDRIEEHEDAGRWAAITGGLQGLLAALLLWVFRAPRSLPSWTLAAGLISSLLVALVMARTATLGGEIRHPEIRSGFQAPAD